MCHHEARVLFLVVVILDLNFRMSFAATTEIIPSEIVQWNETFLTDFSVFLFIPVPSAVKNIHISPSGMTNSLKVNWTPGAGDVDSYTVMLFQQTHQLDSQTVSKHVYEHIFHKLEAGEQYQVVVQSNSGTLHNNLAAFGRTSMFLHG